jgi:nickel-dependent lactate racemase
MTNYQFHYGHGYTQFSLSDQVTSYEILPTQIKPVQSAGQIVQSAIDHPLENIDLSAMIHSNDHVVIVVNDKTRPVPHADMLPPLLRTLEKLGIPQLQITFLIGMGTHTPMPESEFSKILPPEIIRHYRILAHNCEDDENLIYAGTTSRNTPVYVNRLFHEADIKIVVGNIEPHHFAGFSGGAKSASIGVCGRKTITTNHAFLLDEAAHTGNYETNPLRQDIEEIGELIHLDLALNVVMNSDKQILACFLGRPKAVMQAGICVSRKVCMQKIPQLADLVIASAGGFPKDINLYQAQKAMTHASLTLKTGGIILLAAACEEGVGSQPYLEFMQGVNSIEAVYRKFDQLGFQVGPHKAIQIAKILQNHPILLMSSLPADTVNPLLLRPFTDLDHGIAGAFQINPNIHTVAIMPYAVSTIPVFEG